MMKERLETKMDFAGKEYWPTVVGTVVAWNKDIGATHEILCTSAMVAWNMSVFQSVFLFTFLFTFLFAFLFAFVTP